MSFQIQHYVVEEQIIGNGRFGKVVVGRHQLVNERVLIKILEKKNLKQNRDLTSLENEIQCLRSLKHENLIQLYEILESTYNIYMVFELGECNLKQKLFHHQKFQEAQSLIYLQQIVKGVMYLHENNIAHCRLRLDKIILSNGKPKIIGFCDSIRFEKQAEKDYQSIKLQFQSPEMLNLLYYEFDGQRYDVWCLGLMLYQMLQGQLPFDNITSNVDLKNKIKKGQFSINYPVSQSVYSLLEAMLNKDPDKRISLKDLNNYLSNQNLVFEDEYLKVPDEIPNNLIMKELEILQLDTSQLFMQLEQNKHCTLTTCYYLIKKRFFKRAKLNQIRLNISNFENKKSNNVGLLKNSLQIQTKKSRIYQNGNRVQTENTQCNDSFNNYAFKPRSLSKTNNSQNNNYKQLEIPPKMSSTQNSFFYSNNSSVNQKVNKQVNNINFQKLGIISDNYQYQQEKLQQKLKNLLFSNNTSFIVQVSKSKRRSMTVKN